MTMLPIFPSDPGKPKPRAKVPQDWHWSLWERPKMMTANHQWWCLVEFTQEFVFKTKELLERLDPKFDYVVCRPGNQPGSK